MATYPTRNFPRMEPYSTSRMEYVDDDMDAKDFLQDPEMWEDKLPQPYRMINNILNDFVEFVWVKIEEKELLRQRAAAQVKVPSGTEGVVLCQEVLTEVCGGVGCGEEVVVVGNGTSVCVLTCDWNHHDNDCRNEGVLNMMCIPSDECTKVEKRHMLAVLDMNSPISKIEVLQKSEVLIVVVQLATVVKVLAFIRGTLTEIAEVSHMHRDNPSAILGITLSPTYSHLVVTFHCPSVEDTPTLTAITKTSTKGLSNRPSTYASTGSGACIAGNDRVTLGLYSLPIKAWVSEIHMITTQQTGSTSELLTEIVLEDLTFSKPLVLYFIPSPNPLSACMASNPVALFQSVCDEQNLAFPLGNLHCLTDLYFENRWSQFISKRQDFLPACTSFTSAISSQRTVIEQHCPPTSHFLYYKYGHKLECPCEVAIWWEGDLHLTVYTLREAGKVVCLPASKRIPQTSPIVCSSSTDDGSMLALALRSGVLVLWDIKTNFCSKVVPCTDLPDVIVALKFFPNGCVVCLGVGTEQGKVLTISTAPDISQPSYSTISLMSRVQKEQEVYDSMFSCSVYNITSKLLYFLTDPHFPYLLISVHADGSLLFWKPDVGEAVCRLALDSSSYSLYSPSHCSFTKDGNYFLVAGKKKEGECNLVCFDLLSTPFLSCLWTDCPSIFSSHEEATGLQREKEQTLLTPAEVFLHSYTTSQYSDVDDFQIRWQEHWEELPNFLNIHIDNS